MGSSNPNSYKISHISTQCHTVNPNIHLIIQKSGADDEKAHDFTAQNEPMVEVGFNLGGAIRCVLPSRPRPQILESGHDQSYICFYRDCAGAMEYIDEQPVCWLGILLPLDTFRSFFDIPLSDQIDKSASGKGDIVYKLVGPITAGMKVALHQILMCPFLGKTRCLFLEGKVLELISHVRFSADRHTYTASSTAAVNLMADDYERMWQAQTILDEKLESPPSILELAKLVGVNEFKLKNGFRQVYGTTPYKYLADQRLETARQLLWERRVNVTEAAFSVGYSNLSHFAKIFRAKFGVNPHEFLSSSESRIELSYGARQLAL